MKRSLVRLWNRRPLTAAERCTLKACRSCSRAGRTWSVDRRHWHMGRRRYLVTLTLSVAATLGVFMGLVLGTAALGLPLLASSIVIAALTTILCLVLPVPARRADRARRRRARQAKVRLDPDTPIDDLPDDYGDGHTPVPGCCVDCDTELAMQAEIDDHRAVS